MEVLTEIWRIWRHAKALMQRAPLVGTVSGVVSLSASSVDSSIAGCVKIAAAETVHSLSVTATPREVSYKMPAKVAWILRDVLTWPETGAVLDHRRQLIEESIFSTPRLAAILKSACFQSKSIIDYHVPCCTLQIGRWWDNHYHWLIDCLPRVFALHAPQFTQYPLIQLIVSGILSRERDQLLRALLPSNVQIVNIPEGTVVRAKHFILLPFLAGDCAGYLPASYLEFFRSRAFAHFKVEPRTSSSRRILISRRGADKRRLINQGEIESTLAPMGFETVQLETMSLPNQVALFASSSFIVGSHGAGFANLLFAPQCNVLEVFAGSPVSHYRLLSAALSQTYSNLVVQAPDKNTDINVPVQTLSQAIEKVL